MSKIYKTMPRCASTCGGVQCELPADHKKLAHSRVGNLLPWAKHNHCARIGTGVAYWPRGDRKRP